MNLNEFIVKVAEKAIENQNDNGSFSPGHNGPYHDPETPVRNSSHWLITFAKCYDLTGNSIFKDKIYEIAQYLISKKGGV